MGNSPPAAAPPPSILPDFNLKKELAKIKKHEVHGVPSQSIIFCKAHILKNKNPDACYLLARIHLGLNYYHPWNMTIAIPHLIMAVDGGNKNALSYLALFYYLGGYQANRRRNAFKTWKYTKPMTVDPIEGYMPLKRDYKKSFEYFSQAAGYSNDGNVYYFLGRHLEYGHGVKKDHSLALENYRISGNLGNEDARKKFCELCVKKDGESVSDDDLKIILLEKNKIHLGYFHIAKIYEARKNYELAILYCDEQLKRNAGLELEDVDNIRKFRRLVEKNISAPSELKSESEVDALKKQVVDLERDVRNLTNLLHQGTVVKPAENFSIAVPVDAVPPPPPY
ncbi:MAG: hypothetical protein Hyperionvirus16_28 [Hyperionvirus sp.]|uniref:Uncharacterized protein n=1 Tax=Hyperionvirus sp. TaxID=2487770 RepID=A0A3G5ADU2_9VIRU|nr:MAG: hypothetical protein Hyperionvirus16_28 [Hyperionvirus sp.]